MKNVFGTRKVCVGQVSLACGCLLLIGPPHHLSPVAGAALNQSENQSAVEAAFTFHLLLMHPRLPAVAGKLWPPRHMSIIPQTPCSSFCCCCILCFPYVNRGSNVSSCLLARYMPLRWEAQGQIPKKFGGPRGAGAQLLKKVQQLTSILGCCRQ